MRDIHGLMQLAFGLAHDVSEASLDLERTPGLRGRGVHARLIADSGVSALAHVASASADLSEGGFNGRLRATSSLRGAREELKQLRDRVHTVATANYISETAASELTSRIDELATLIMALSVEVRGGRSAA
ncbi:MAG: hypothetical protein IPI85_01530 [Dehalococcoidia bacterium]|nr:hypothetical protein [Dehalococcoidia bacterium]